MDSDSNFEDILAKTARRMGRLTFGHPPGGRDPERIPVILEVLRDVWMKYPDLRLGQMIVCACEHENPRQDTFNTEDEVALAGLLKMKEGM